MSTFYGAGTPLKPAQSNLYRGVDRSNGFVMKSPDNRIPAVREGFTRLGIGSGNVLFPVIAVPYGNALFRDTSSRTARPGMVYTDKPTKSKFVGILEFNQANQNGNPLLNWGMQQFQRGKLVRSGLVGYKQSMVYNTSQQANYLLLLQNGIGSSTDTTTTRLTYDDWVTLADAGADGDRLALFFDNVSGFPIVKMVVAANINAPTTGLTGVTFAAYESIWEKENKTVFFKLDATSL